MEPNVQQILKALEEGRVVRAPGAYLRGANLSKPIVQRDNPNGAIVQWANIEGTILRNIEDSSFIGLEQDGIRFIYGNLSGADFNGADLRNVCTEAGMFAIRDGRDYVVGEDLMKAARKLAEAKKLESELSGSKL